MKSKEIHQINKESIHTDVCTHILSIYTYIYKQHTPTNTHTDIHTPTHNHTNTDIQTCRRISRSYIYGHQIFFHLVHNFQYHYEQKIYPFIWTNSVIIVNTTVTVSSISAIQRNIFLPIDSHRHKATSALQTLKNGSWTVRIVRYRVQIYFKL